MNTLADNWTIEPNRGLFKALLFLTLVVSTFGATATAGWPWRKPICRAALLLFSPQQASDLAAELRLNKDVRERMLADPRYSAVLTPLLNTWAFLDQAPANFWHDTSWALWGNRYTDRVSMITRITNPSHWPFLRRFVSRRENLISDVAQGNSVELPRDVNDYLTGFVNAFPHAQWDISRREIQERVGELIRETSIREFNNVTRELERLSDNVTQVSRRRRNKIERAGLESILKAVHDHLFRASYPTIIMARVSPNGVEMIRELVAKEFNKDGQQYPRLVEATTNLIRESDLLWRRTNPEYPMEPDGILAEVRAILIRDARDLRERWEAEQERARAAIRPQGSPSDASVSVLPVIPRSTHVRGRRDRARPPEAEPSTPLVAETPAITPLTTGQLRVLRSEEWKTLLANPNSLRFDDFKRLCTAIFGEPRRSGNGSSHFVFDLPWPGRRMILVQYRGSRAEPAMVRTARGYIERFVELHQDEIESE